MHRDVQGAEFQANDALDFFFGDVGHRHVRAAHKAVSIIVVLYVKAGTHVFWQLVNETENAVIFAHHGFHVDVKFKPQRLSVFLVYVDGFWLAVTQNIHREFSLVVIKKEVQLVNHVVAANAQHVVSELESLLFCDVVQLNYLWHITIFLSVWFLLCLIWSVYRIFGLLAADLFALSTGLSVLCVQNASHTAMYADKNAAMLSMLLISTHFLPFSDT